MRFQSTSSLWTTHTSPPLLLSQLVTHLTTTTDKLLMMLTPCLSTTLARAHTTRPTDGPIITTREPLAGRKLLAEPQESQSQFVMQTTTWILISATTSVTRASLATVQSAGRLAQIILRAMELTATSHTPMEEVLVRSSSAKAVRNGELSGTQLARRTTTMWAAACAHQIAHMA